jgi:hypothetical protein
MGNAAHRRVGLTDAVLAVCLAGIIRVSLYVYPHRATSAHLDPCDRFLWKTFLFVPETVIVLVVVFRHLPPYIAIFFLITHHRPFLSTLHFKGSSPGRKSF